MTELANLSEVLFESSGEDERHGRTGVAEGHTQGGPKTKEDCFLVEAMQGGLRFEGPYLGGLR